MVVQINIDQMCRTQAAAPEEEEEEEESHLSWYIKYENEHALNAIYQRAGPKAPRGPPGRGRGRRHNDIGHNFKMIYGHQGRRSACVHF